MRYRIELAPAAARQLRQLPKAAQRRVATKIDLLKENPRPPGVETLSGNTGFYRIRVGDYRVIYTARDDVLLVLVLRVGHRRDVYRKPP